MKTFLHRPRLAAFLAVVVALMAGAAWLLGREETVRWVAARAEAMSGEKLTIEQPSGSLLTHVRASRLAWRDDNGPVEANDVSMTWSPLWLLAGVVAFDHVHVAALNVTRVSSTAPPALPTSLHPPLRVRLSRVEVDNFTVVRGDEPQQINRLVFSAHADWRNWRVVLRDVSTAWGTLRGRGEMAMDPPFGMTFDADFKQADRKDGTPLATATLNATGTAERFDVKARARAGVSAADVMLTIASLAPQPIQRIEASLRTFNPHEFAGALPAAALDGTLQAATDTDGILRGNLQIDNKARGTLDQKQLPLVRLAATIAADAREWKFDDLLIDLGDAGQLAGSGSAAREGLALALHTDRLDLHGVHTALRSTKLGGSLEGSGDLDAQRVRLALSQQRMKFALDATVEPTRVTVTRARASAGDSSAEASGTLALDARRSFVIKAALTRFDPAQWGDYRKASLNGRLSASGEIAPVLQVQADATLTPSTAFGLPASGHGRWRSRGVDNPDIAVDVKATVGETQIDAKGTLVDPENLRALDLMLALKGRDLAQLYTLTGLPFPATPAYSIDGHLTFRDKVWSMRQFKGQVGRSDLAGDFAVELRQPRPFMRADATSERLDMRDLGGFLGANENAGPSRPPGRVLPHTAYDVKKINAADADVKLVARSIRNEKLPLERMNARLKLNGGQVTVDPLHFAAAGGEIDARIGMDARQTPIRTLADMQARGLQLNRLAPGVKAVLESAGTIDGRTQLAMRGNSVADMLGSADGDLVLLMSGGSISELMLRLADLDVANALRVLARGKPNVPIRCLVTEFAANNGVLTPKTFVLDTDSTRVDGQGEIDLRNERLALQLIAKPKDGSLFALRGPIRLDGTFAQPNLRPDLKGAMARVGAAAALGAVATPFAAVVPFLQLGDRTETNCSPLIVDASRFVQAAPASSVPTATARR